MNKIAFLAFGLLLGAPNAGATEYDAALEALARKQIYQIVAAREVIHAVMQQNTRTADYSQNQIDELDRQWKREVGSAERPLIQSVMDNELADFLSLIQKVSNGLFTEVFVMDARGLNVGQSTVTSDYWQGDEPKWRRTFRVGKEAIFIDELEKDDSTGVLQSQVSISIVEPESGEIIGAATFGVNVGMLSSGRPQG